MSNTRAFNDRKITQWNNELTALVHPTSGNSLPAISRSGIPTICIIGDSIGSEYAQSGACTAATYDTATGTATLTFSSLTNIDPGDVCDVVGMTDSGYDVFGVPVTVDGTTVTYQVAGGATGTPSGASSGAILAYTWQPGTYIGILSWAKFISGARFNFVQRAIGGSQITATIDRFDRDVPATNPHLVLLSIGTNDIYNAGTSAATLIAGLDSLLVKCRQIGTQFGVIVPPPQSSGRANWSAAKLLIQNQFRNAVHVWGMENACPVFDTHTASAGTTQYLNAGDANGNHTTGYSIDGIHPSTLGSYAIGKRIAAWLSGILPRREFLVAGAGDASNLINGLMTGTGGSGADSGSVATNYTVSKPAGTSTVAASIAARTVAADGDTCGRNQVLEITSASSGAQVQIAHSSVHANVSNGDELECGLHLQVSSATDLKYLYVYLLTQTATTGNKQHYYFANGGGNAYAIPEDFSGVIDLPANIRGPNATHGNPSACTLYILAAFGTSGAGAATIKVGRGTLRKKI